MNKHQNASVSDLADTCFLIETLLKNPLSVESRSSWRCFVPKSRGNLNKPFAVTNHMTAPPMRISSLVQPFGVLE